MATCGYICPACEGRGLDEHGNPYPWCSLPDRPVVEDSIPIENEEWMKNTHEGNCCAGEE